MDDGRLLQAVRRPFSVHSVLDCLQPVSSVSFYLMSCVQPTTTCYAQPSKQSQPKSNMRQLASSPPHVNNAVHETLPDTAHINTLLGTPLWNQLTVPAPAAPRKLSMSAASNALTMSRWPLPLPIYQRENTLSGEMSTPWAQ